MHMCAIQNCRQHPADMGIKRNIYPKKKTDYYYFFVQHFKGTRMHDSQVPKKKI